jgi:octaprenyl-diphosphate synthase
MRLDNIFVTVKQQLSSFDKTLKEELSSDSSLVFEVAKHILDGKGKRLRPSLVFLCCGICDGKGKNASKVAVAVDLIHNATLLHDDVIDQSPTRRGKASVNSKWNNLVSILMGDYLLAKAFKMMNQSRSLELFDYFSKAAERLSIGELRQVQESRNYQFDEKTYLRIIEDKTASLFSASCVGGGIVADAKEEQKKHLSQYGHNLGISFQIADDVLDFVGESKKTGKGLGNDLKEGKITLPLIYTLRQADSATKRRIIRLLEKDFNYQDFVKILSLVREYGGVEYAKWRADIFGQKALGHLSGFRNSPYKQSLVNMVDFAVNRDR